jgi:hypothetical protein
MIVLILGVPFLFLGMCTVAAVIGSARRDGLEQRPVPPVAAQPEESDATRLCA